jgi:hypothetical protein
MEPASPAESLAMKVLLGHVLAELALLNERASGTSAERWLSELQIRVLADLGNASVAPLAGADAARLSVDAHRITERFFARTRYIAAAIVEDDLGGDWPVERRWIVPDDHPYCTGRLHVPDVYAVGKEWKIAWRSFDSIKQDQHYPTEQQAREAAARIAQQRVVASACDEEQLREFSEFWLDAAGMPKSDHSRFKFIELTAG